jgi:hypothetical protein
VKRLYKLEIDANDLAHSAHGFGRHLKPTTGSRSKIDDEITGFHQPKALLKLQQLVSGSRAVTFLLGFFIIGVVGFIYHFVFGAKKSPARVSGWAFEP